MSKNNWKNLFLSLLTVNIVVLISLLTLVFWPTKDEEILMNEPFDEQDSSEFTVRTTKHNLNELVNAYIDQLLQDTKHHYQISLDDDVHLIGEVPVFSTTVPLSIHLEPIVLDHGDVVLKQKSIHVGLLKLPNKKIMEYIDKYLAMPEWVTVQPKDESIHVAVSEMDIKSNFRVAVENFDLDANNLSFKIKVPYKTLGIETVEPF